MWLSTMRKKEKHGFLENCLTPFVSGREKTRISCTLSVFGQKSFSENQATIKIVVSAEIAQNLK